LRPRKGLIFFVVTETDQCRITTSAKAHLCGDAYLRLLLHDPDTKTARWSAIGQLAAEISLGGPHMLEHVLAE